MYLCTNCNKELKYIDSVFTKNNKNIEIVKRIYFCKDCRMYYEYVFNISKRGLFFNKYEWEKDNW
jgi:hypothetical protein